MSWKEPKRAQVSIKLLSVIDISVRHDIFYDC